MTLPTVFIVFIESKHIFSNNITDVRVKLFRDYKTAVGSNNSAQTIRIISTFYKNNFQNKRS